MTLKMVVMMNIVFFHVELLLFVNVWWKTPSHGAKKSHNVYIDIQFWTSVASLFQQTPPWKSPSTDSFDKVNHVQGHSGFSVLPVSQSVFQCSGAVLIEVKGPTNMWSLFETVKNLDVFHGRKRIFMNFSANFTEKFGRQISYWFWVLVKCVASGTSWTFFSKILNSICHRVKSWNNKKHTHRLMRPSFGWLWL